MSDRFVIPSGGCGDEVDVARLNTRTDNEFETLLYAISISVSRHRALIDVSKSLHESAILVRDAVALSLRLHLLSVATENPAAWHESWEYARSADASKTEEETSRKRAISINELKHSLTHQHTQKRIALVFNSKLVASLMVGKFPTKLKHFAVRKNDTLYGPIFIAI